MSLETTMDIVEELEGTVCATVGETADDFEMALLSSARKKKLSRADWIEAGLMHVNSEGYRALSVEGVARSLGVTKGSFYGHFKNLAELTDAVIDAIDQEERDWMRQHSAHQSGATSALSLWERDTDLTLRRWAAENKKMHKLVAKIDRSRLARISELFEAEGIDAAKLPLIFYALQLGFDQLSESLGNVPEAARLSILNAKN